MPHWRRVGRVTPCAPGTHDAHNSSSDLRSDPFLQFAAGGTSVRFFCRYPSFTRSNALVHCVKTV